MSCAQVSATCGSNCTVSVMSRVAQKWWSAVKWEANRGWRVRTLKYRSNRRFEIRNLIDILRGLSSGKSRLHSMSRPRRPYCFTADHRAIQTSDSPKLGSLQNNTSLSRSQKGGIIRPAPMVAQRRPDLKS